MLAAILFFFLLFILPLTVTGAAIVRLLFGLTGSRKLTIWALVLTLPHTFGLLFDVLNRAATGSAFTVILLTLPLLSMAGAVLLTVSGLKTRRRYFLIEGGCLLLLVLAMMTGAMNPAG